MRWRAWLGSLLAMGTAMHGCMAMAQEAHRPLDDPQLARAWQALRIVNCERCHGPGHTGLAAPSIVEYASTHERADFARMVLEGDLPRGMPAYRGNPLVSDNINGIYLYFLGRADRSIGVREQPGSTER